MIYIGDAWLVGMKIIIRDALRGKLQSFLAALQSVE